MPAIPRDRLIGVALAGGESRRFGRDKALLSFGETTLVSSAVAKLSVAVAGPALVADRGRNLHPRAQSIQDGPGRGPAAAILGAAAHDPAASLLVLACDMPFVTVELLIRLSQLSGDFVLPRWGPRLEPLCSLLRSKALAALTKMVSDGRFAVRGLLQGNLEVTFLEGPELTDLGRPEDLFLNLNTPSDLHRAESLRARGQLAGTPGSG